MGAVISIPGVAPHCPQGLLEDPGTSMEVQQAYEVIHPCPPTRAEFCMGLYCAGLMLIIMS